MPVTITTEILSKVFRNTKAETLSQYVPHLNKYLAEFGIDTKDRVAHFLGQTGHESMEYKRTSENLNYGWQGLRSVFPKYFCSKDPAKDEELKRKAIDYERNPEKIASYVYANRMGNGPEESGDGWKHRGVGLIQTTGKNNQTSLATKLGMKVEAAIEFAKTPEGAVKSACIFWKENNLNRFADRGDFLGLTKAINGGTFGLDDRKKLTEHAIAALK